MFPTPNACDANRKEADYARASRDGSGGDDLQTAVAKRKRLGGTLNPGWIEWLMGWPIGWTSLEPLTDPINLGPETWDVEPDIPRVTTGQENRVARIKAIGNGQVPPCAATAWRILTEEFK